MLSTTLSGLLSCGLLTAGLLSGTGVATATPTAITDANWAGYADTLPSNSGYTIISASGYWTVPTVQSPAGSSSAYSSFWVGIDGFNNKSLEQIGITADVLKGVPVYFGWWEMLTASTTPPQQIITDVVISSGDKIGAGIVYNPATQAFNMLLEDVTSGASFTTTQTGDGTGMSAEWVAEDPTIMATGKLFTLANFGTVDFSGAGLGVENSAGSIFNGPVDSISNMGGTTYAMAIVQNNNAMALPGVLSDSGSGAGASSSFTVTYQQPVPQPPALDFLALAGMAILFIRRRAGGRKKRL